jgi:hypothetical protein
VCNGIARKDEQSRVVEFITGNDARKIRDVLIIECTGRNICNMEGISEVA